MKLKKNLGQHLLIQPKIAERIVSLLNSDIRSHEAVLEIGPGKGALTNFLLTYEDQLWLIEKDNELVVYLQEKFPTLRARILAQDVLTLNLTTLPMQPVHIIGNMPYNISGPLLFMALEQRNYIAEWIGMLQKEVVERVVARPGNKTYGMLSVLIQAYFDAKKHFDISRGAFIPPPEVTSSVLKLVPKQNKIPCSYDTLKKLTKAAFQQRRKKLSNALSKFSFSSFPGKYETKRAEELSWEDFVELALHIESYNSKE
jgi:16S rRNA (adenine1518-N6/adenine1519-N6)-dimethyltransferase